MKFASYKAGRDGELRLVSRDLQKAIAIPGMTISVKHCLDNWERLLPSIDECYQRINDGEWNNKSTDFDTKLCTAPLPRATQWLDGSAYVNHVELARKARGAPMPDSFWTDPLMYQGVSDSLLGPCDTMTGKPEWGVDFEAELAVITNDVPMGCTSEDAHQYIMLVTLCNDISLRNLIPDELNKGFGFLHSKPPSSFGAVAVTPDELGQHWQNGKLNLPMQVSLNGNLFGHPNCATDMTFSFHDLIAHAAKTRPLGRGTIIGSGTVSNKDKTTGSCCLVEKRMLEIIADGKPKTPYLQTGDSIRIEIKLPDGSPVFGAIEQNFSGTIK